MIHVVYNDGQQDIFLDSLLQSVVWSGDIMQAARKLEVKIINTIDGKKRLLDINEGRPLRLLEDDAELFIGVIFGDDIDITGQHTITAYDENIYLTNNQDTRRFVNMTASAIIKTLCHDFGVPIGSITDTGYVIPKLILRDKSLWDMMITALTVSTKQTGKRYFLWSRSGKLNLSLRSDQPVKWVLENGVNITGASYSRSIEEMRNQIKVITNVGESNEKSVTKRNDELIKRYGLMQHIETASSELSDSELQQLANQLLDDKGKIKDEASVEGLGISDVYSGKSIYVIESMTGIIGAYHTITDEHTWDENGTHTMRLTLSATDELPTLEYKETE